MGCRGYSDIPRRLDYSIKLVRVCQPEIMRRQKGCPRQGYVNCFCDSLSAGATAVNVSKALGTVTEKERKATIRNTRTLMNGAQTERTIHTNLK